MRPKTILFVKHFYRNDAEGQDPCRARQHFQQSERNIFRKFTLRQNRILFIIFALCWDGQFFSKIISPTHALTAGSEKFWHFSAELLVNPSTRPYFRCFFGNAGPRKFSAHSCDSKKITNKACLWLFPLKTVKNSFSPSVWISPFWQWQF